jgi:hypothetical protein
VLIYFHVLSSASGKYLKSTPEVVLLLSQAINNIVSEYEGKYLPVFTGDKFISGPTQQNMDSDALSFLFLIIATLFPFRKEAVCVRQKMVWRWSNWLVEGEKFSKEICSP